MTDQPSTPSDDDLSASLDGEADPTVERAIEGDASARARRDELGAAAAWVAASPPEPLAADQVDELIATALAAPTAPAARARRGRPSWLVAAAVIALLGIGLTFIWQGRQPTDTAARFNTVGNSINAEKSSGAADTGGASHGLATTIAPAEPADASPSKAAIDLGDFASGAALRKALATTFPSAPAPGTEATAPRPTKAQVDRCAQQLQVALTIQGDPTKVGYGTVAGKPVLVYEFDHESYKDQQPTTLVAAVGKDACDEVVFFER